MDPASYLGIGLCFAIVAIFLLSRNWEAWENSWGGDAMYCCLALNCYNLPRTNLQERRITNATHL